MRASARGQWRYEGSAYHLLVGHGPLLELLRGEVAGPRVEDLDDLRPRVDLVERVLANVLGELARGARRDSVRRVSIG